MERMKYVVIEDETFGMSTETIILFPATLVHKTFKQFRAKIVSAGFVGPTSKQPCGWWCYGDSESLKLKCRPVEDQRLLEILLRKD